MAKVQAAARVQLTLEFAVGGQVWGADCSVEQIHKQAREKAIEILGRGLSVEGNVSRDGPKARAEIVGNPVITAILVEEQR
jgi:hypothetical protein